MFVIALYLDQIIKRVDPKGRNLSLYFHEEIAEPFGKIFSCGLMHTKLSLSLFLSFFLPFFLSFVLSFFLSFFLSLLNCGVYIYFIWECFSTLYLLSSFLEWSVGLPAYFSSHRSLIPSPDTPSATISFGKGWSIHYSLLRCDLKEVLCLCMHTLLCTHVKKKSKPVASDGWRSTYRREQETH